MTQVHVDEFTRFAREKLRPVVQKVQTGRRRGLIYAIAAGVIVFVIFVIVVALFLAPFRDILDNNSITYWPLLFLAPLAFAMVGFSIAYILLLRNTVAAFRTDIIDHIAEFVDPGIVHEQGQSIPDDDMDKSLLFRSLAKPKSGSDRFRGRAGSASVEFTDLQISLGDNKKVPLLSGIYFVAHLPKRLAMPFLSFPTSVEVSRSGMEEELRLHGYPLTQGLVRREDPSDERQVLLPSGQEQSLRHFLPVGLIDAVDSLRQEHGVETLLSAFDDRLHIAMLSANERTDLPGVFEGFDFAHCRQFCQNARLAMEITRFIASQQDLFEK